MEKLIGEWIEIDGKIVENENCKIIRDMIDTRLKDLGSDWSGWDKLFLENGTGKYWHRYFPKGEMHGGGPATLENISEEKAKELFPNLF